MHRKTVAAVVLSLCTIGAAAPAAATAAVTDGTSNTIMFTESSPALSLINLTKITYTT